MPPLNDKTHDTERQRLSARAGCSAIDVRRRRPSASSSDHTAHREDRPPSRAPGLRPNVQHQSRPLVRIHHVHATVRGVRLPRTRSSAWRDSPWWTTIGVVNGRLGASLRSMVPGRPAGWRDVRASCSCTGSSTSRLYRYRRPVPLLHGFRSGRSRSRSSCSCRSPISAAARLPCRPRRIAWVTAVDGAAGVMLTAPVLRHHRAVLSVSGDYCDAAALTERHRQSR